MVIMLVDDSKAMRERLVSLLSELDEDVVIGQAGNSKEALEGIQALRPEVVILDIQMPGGSGLGVLEAVKQGQNAPVVIMLTNHNYPQYRDRCMGLGADFFLDKTRDIESLSPILKDLIRRQA